MTTTVVLTATVIPHAGVQVLSLADPRERLNQYCASLSVWAQACRHMGFSLCLVDNSSELPARDREALEAAAAEAALGFFPDLDPHPNKGVGEARLLDAAFTSGLLDGSSRIVKCTGRLFIANLAACFPDEPRSESLQVLLNSRLTAADSRVFGATTDVWKTYLLGLDTPQLDLSRGFVAFEQALARATLRALSDGVPLTRFPALPRWVGQSGGHGTDYGSLRQRVKRSAHAAVRTAASKGHWAI